MTTLANTIREHIAAGFPALYVRTEEPEEALREIRALAIQEGWNLATWDCDSGLNDDQASTDPHAAIRALGALAGDQTGVRGVLLMRNLHRFTADPIVSQAVERAAHIGKTTGAHLIVTAPVVDIPVELARTFTILDHDLPDRPALEKIARETAYQGEIADQMPEGEELARLLDAAAGLTRAEAENAFALSIVRHDRITTAELWEQKTATLKKTGLLTLHRGGETFADLGGLDALKHFGRLALRPGRPTHVVPRGILLVGVPGTGKSAFAKALGNETGRPTLTLDIGAMMGSLVGQTEENIRRALRTADMMAPCVLFVDEIEKALGGNGGENDGGVSRRLFGTLLTWLNDHTSDVFFVATANNVAALPPEFSRAERFDGIFMLDSPGLEERRRIWAMYRKAFDIAPSDPIPADEGWTGAEIKSACRLAALLGTTLAEASRNVVPVTITAAEQITALRRWAHNRVLDANRPGPYLDPATAAAKAPSGQAPSGRRKINRPTGDGSN